MKRKIATRRPPPPPSLPPTPPPTHTQAKQIDINCIEIAGILGTS